MKSETTANVIRFYYLTMLDEEIIKLRTDSVKALEENLRVVTAGFKGGSLASIDQLRAKVSLANERTRLINAENDYQNMESSLNVLIGRDIAAPLTLDRKSLTIQQGEITKLTAIDATEQNRQLAELVGIAMKNRPEIVQLRYKKDIAEASGNLDRSVYMWPNFFIEGNYGTSKVINQQELPAGAPNAQLLNEITDMLSPPGWNKSWTVTAGVSYKWGALSPLDPSQAKSLQDESRQKQSDIETDDFIKQLHLEVQRGLLKMISAAHALESQNDNTQSAQEYFRIAVLQFRNGMIDNTKLLDANVELKNAQTLYIQALFDLQTAKSDLNRAIGYDYFQIQ